MLPSPELLAGKTVILLGSARPANDLFLSEKLPLMLALVDAVTAVEMVACPLSMESSTVARALVRGEEWRAMKGWSSTDDRLGRSAGLRRSSWRIRSWASRDRKAGTA